MRFECSRINMPRNYVRQVGSRRYVDYSNETLQKCLDDIRSGRHTQTSASQAYNIPRSTIKNKLKDVFNKKPGRPTVLSEDQEKAFEEHIFKMAEFGFPLTELDLRFIVKGYFDKIGRAVPQFKNNLPGIDWVRAFRKRNPKLTVRECSNIKTVRAAVDEDVIKKYFNNITDSIKNVPPENLWNYDETNLRDDPGTNKVICKRGVKYLERVMNSTKTCTSIMMCGNAVGEMLSPYVVYKSEHLWSTWTEGGPEGCRYNRTKNGWFDMTTFEDWFFSCLLPKLKKQKGIKVLIGDNLSSHINTEVIKACEKYDIRFVCLPAHSSHLTQPLDVAYFAPMKSMWRKILTTWKESEYGRNLSNIPKDVFPKLLKELIDTLYADKSNNIVSGFRKAGIYPLNQEKVLERLPQKSVDSSIVSESFIEHISRKREEIKGMSKTAEKKRRKKLNAPPGKSICYEDLLQQESGPSASSAGRARVAKQKKIIIEENDSTNEDSDMTLHDISDDLNFSDSEDDVGTDQAQCFPKMTLEEKKRLKEGNFIIVSYENQYYAGLIHKMPDENEEGPTVDCMERKSKCWMWPEKKDKLIYSWKDIVCRIEAPKLLNKRGHFKVPELDVFV